MSTPDFLRASAQIDLQSAISNLGCITPATVTRFLEAVQFYVDEHEPNFSTHQIGSCIQEVDRVFFSKAAEKILKAFDAESLEEIAGVLDELMIIERPSHLSKEQTSFVVGAADELRKKKCNQAFQDLHKSLLTIEAVDPDYAEKQVQSLCDNE